MGAHSYSIPCTTSAEARTVWGLDLNLVVVWWWNSNQMRKGKIDKLHHQNATVYEEVYGGVGRHAHWTPPRCTVQCISGLSLNLLSFQLYTQTFMWVSLLSFQYSCAIRICQGFFSLFLLITEEEKNNFLTSVVAHVKDWRFLHSSGVSSANFWKGWTEKGKKKFSLKWISMNKFSFME